MLPLYEREENNGLQIMMTLDGPRKHDSTFVNATAKQVCDLLKEGKNVGEIVDAMQARYPEVPTGQLKVDIFKVLMNFVSYGLCELQFADWLSLLPAQDSVPGEFQMLPPCMAPQVADFIRSGYGQEPDAGKVELLFTLRRKEEDPTGAAYAAAPILFRHIRAEETFFVSLDDRSRIRSVVSIAGFGAQIPTQKFAIVATAAQTPEEFDARTIATLQAMEAMWKMLPTVSKARFAMGQDAQTKTWLTADGHERFLQVIGQLGYRREAYLRHELGLNKDLVIYSKILN